MSIDALPADVFYLLAAMLLPVDLASLLRTCRACAAHGRSWQLWSVRAIVRLGGQARQFNAFRQHKSWPPGIVYCMFSAPQNRSGRFRVRMPSTSVLIKVPLSISNDLQVRIETVPCTPETIWDETASGIELIYRSWHGVVYSLHGTLKASWVSEGGVWFIEMDLSPVPADAIDAITRKPRRTVSFKDPFRGSKSLAQEKKFRITEDATMMSGRYAVTITYVGQRQDDGSWSVR